MRQTISKKRVVFIASLISITALSLFAIPVQAAPTQPSTDSLQKAVDQICKSPKVAEQLLKSNSSPTAKSYLAFLYFSRKDIFPNQQKQVDSLLRRAIAQIQDKDALGDVDVQNIHCKKVAQVLKYLRFVSEADGRNSVLTPAQIFEKYPEACSNAFAPYWFSSRECALPFRLNKTDDLQSIPAFKTFSQDVLKINGVEDQISNGTMVYGNYRLQDLNAVQAALAPQLFCKQMNSQIGMDDYKNLSEFLKHWSLLELYNHRAFALLQADSTKAVAPLASHFAQRFHLTPKLANAYAEATLKSFTLAYLGRYSHTTLNEQINKPIYKIFSDKIENLTSLQSKIGKREMTKEELSDALSMQILNGGNLEVIEWLIKSGAPLASGIEPPLLSAVDRPDVITALLKAGASVNQTNGVGKTALIQAAQYDDLKTLQELLSAGAEINRKMVESDQAKNPADGSIYFSYNTGARTALMYSAAFASAKTTTFLLSKGADKNAKDSENKKAVDFVSWNRINSKAEKAELLKELR